MDIYHLKVSNLSIQATFFAIYQALPDINNDTVYTLVWQGNYAYPDVTVNFYWQENYNAFWSQPGQHLGFGVICNTSRLDTAPTQSSQIIPVDLTNKNDVTLNYDLSHNAFYFNALTDGESGHITIHCSASVPNASTAPASSVVGVGIGMDGTGTHIVGGLTNISNIWEPTNPPQYYLINGN